MNIPLTFRKSFLDPEEAGVALTMAAGGAGEDEKQLGIAVEGQKGDRWCWAAVAVSLRRVRRKDLPPLEQCQLAQIVIPGDLHCCGTLKAPTECDKAAFLEDALTASEVSFSGPDSTFSFPAICDHIRGDRPVACRIDFPPPELPHFVVVDGFNADDRKLSVEDPKRGPLTMTVTSFVTDYNGEGGTWGATFRIG